MGCCRPPAKSLHSKLNPITAQLQRLPLDEVAGGDTRHPAQTAASLWPLGLAAGQGEATEGQR